VKTKITRKPRTITEIVYQETKLQTSQVSVPRKQLKEINTRTAIFLAKVYKESTNIDQPFIPVIFFSSISILSILDTKTMQDP
jgi:hypothetical protein